MTIVRANSLKTPDKAARSFTTPPVAQQQRNSPSSSGIDAMRKGGGQTLRQLVLRRSPALRKYFK